jgi:hypothetical protein
MWHEELCAAINDVSTELLPPPRGWTDRGKAAKQQSSGRARASGREELLQLLSRRGRARVQYDDQHELFGCTWSANEPRVGEEGDL